MSPPDPRHATTIVVGEEALQAAFGAGYHIRVQLPLALGDDSEPEPDLAVVPRSRQAFRTSHPTTAVLVVEAADSSLLYDRDRKEGRYARAGIAEYWIVNLVDQLLEVYRDPRPDIGYATRLLFRPADEVMPLAEPATRIAVSDLL